MLVNRLADWSGMDELETNFLAFIGAEETNLLVAMVKCNRDITFFPSLDGAYQAPLKFIDVNINDEYKKTILSLYFFTHYHLYFSTACLLRCHLSDSLGSTRKAIDSTLTAYRLIDEPNTLSQYQERHKSYQNIKSYVSRQMKHDKTKFPLAREIIALHDLCSEFGSHADISTFIHRVLVVPTQKEGKGLFKMNMFQAPDRDIELRYYLVQTLRAYAMMLKVFSVFIGELAVGLDLGAWNLRINELIQASATESFEIKKQINPEDNG